MGDFSTKFGFEKMRSGNASVYKLREQLEKFSSAPEKAGACEEIAQSFYQLEQYGEAATWYEAAGRLVLNKTVPLQTMKALLALEPYEKALECYEMGNDEEGFTECSELLRQLRRACASA